ncbi:MAG: HAMP domain-containing sensor histidine kinase [Mesobacillus sp.]|uniref:ATP-binding protein n=1 Tax=Mesobacillus sp. TaxID=2675271 RepID=UPI003C4A8717
MDLLTVLVLNLIFILISTFAAQYIIAEHLSAFFKKFAKPAIILIAGIQIGFCISFSLIATEHFMFDLRLIPIVLGGLYGGPIVSIVLFMIAIVARIPFGGSGIWVSFFNTLTITVFISYISVSFKEYPLAKKLYTVVGIAVSYTILIFLMKAAIFNDPSELWFIFIYGITLTAGIFIVTYFIEITKQNNYLYKAMIKSDKIEVVSHLAASVSHEVRNPLTVTRGFLQMLKDPSITEDKRLFYLNTAIDELDRAETIIKDYLSFAKPQSKITSAICVKDEIEKALELIIPYANHFSVNIKKDLMTGLYVYGEAPKFHQCILNIIKNGIEAMPEGGDMLISTREKENGLASIVIKDTGCGMSAKQLAKLGEPYYSTKAEKGTGLGMMVVYKIIHEMAGTIEVQSKLDEGTQFTITLPLSS